MIKILQKSARTEEEAVRLALEELGLTRDDVSVEIVERAKSALFGLKVTPAVVNVSYEVPDEPVPAPIETYAPPVAEPKAYDKPQSPQSPQRRPAERNAAPRGNATPRDNSAPRREREQGRDRYSEREALNGDGEGQIEPLREFLTGLLTRFGVPSELDITAEGSTVSVVITASEPGALIGRRGETLDAIQHLSNYVVNHKLSGSNRVRVNVDTENYRARRGETLETLADKTAAKVLKYRRNVTLDPMNAYERHVIHAALQEKEGVSTYSVGSEPNRRVVVAYGSGNNRASRDN
ncbi:MAG: Jag N-terminal domain-containing protein [Oscillospiraceae bacterium]|jgi:spoIIIJ-associated protein|nr:Jag N-terminal domain-containing protein [Oscillospiraceae bacterium]